MALVFQYGSNLSTARLNDPTRLRGDARLVGKAVTQGDYVFEFDIWSEANGGRAASDIVAGHGRKIWGVIYEVPDYLIRRETAAAKQRRSLDEIEAKGKNYDRVEIKLRWRNGRAVTKPVITYIGKARRKAIQTTLDYVQHILAGLEEHKMPKGYVRYVKSCILTNNPELRVAI